MSTRFDLPVLSDKTYATLLQELTASIPRYSDNWTDYNFSDPGTTLLQLLAWLGDVTLYRIDTVPPALYLNFARWLVGASGSALDDLVDELENDVLRNANGSVIYIGGNSVIMDPARLALALYLQDIENGRRSDLNTLRRRAIDYWTAPYRAVTTADFRALAFQVGAAAPTTSPEYVLRQVVVQVEPPFIAVTPVTDYPYGYSTTAVPGPTPTPVILTLTAKIQTGALAYVMQCYGTLVLAIQLYLKPRLLLGTPVRVALPTYNPVNVTVRLAVLDDADPTAVANGALAAVQELLSVSTGGSDGRGWPYGREVNDYDVLNAVARVAGVDDSQPIHVDTETLLGFQVGAVTLGSSSLVQGGPTVGLPWLWQVVIEVRTDTWTLELNRHSRVGIDTVLAYQGL